ncbi:MAG: Fe-S cluster assembly protein SufD [Steroidobacteraceae bacterium]|nr:Fe-S cluster assembly protein SufD [Steroidobacteraceae bacterium]
MNAAVAAPVAHYRAAFDALRATAPAADAQRAAAFEHFAALGFPAARDEAWKYTSLRRLEARRFPARDAARDPLALPAPLASHRLALVDGRRRADLSSGGLPEGLVLRTLAEVHAAGESIAALLRTPQGGGTERFAALNAALCPDPLLLEVAEGAHAEPLEIVVASTAAEPGMSHPRLVIRAARGSTSRLLLRHVGDDAERLVNSVVDVEVGPDATVHIYRLLDNGPHTFHIERIDATVGQRGTVLVHDAQLGAGLARLDLNARLAAPQAAAELTGLFLADGSRHLDTHVLVDHLSPGTRSLQDYRGVAAGRGRAVFNGKAVVHPGAQQSQARQSSRNLLLTPGAEIDTKPELEIYADDVQCSHGATTGQLDAAALFYLRSRGLSETEARSALTRAFTGAVLSRMDHATFATSVRAALDARLERLLETQP